VGKHRWAPLRPLSGAAGAGEHVLLHVEARYSEMGSPCSHRCAAGSCPATSHAGRHSAEAVLQDGNTRRQTTDRPVLGTVGNSFTRVYHHN
jgi:hypothetical protein